MKKLLLMSALLLISLSACGGKKFETVNDPQDGQNEKYKD